ncbi:MAG: metallophosphoesterase [Rhizobacter sp.]|nr:metallophosphoesterase [Rhizobacter sp.]
MLLHISDPHFGTEQPEVVDALLRLTDTHRPELVLLSGDITQRARRSQFRAAREFVDRLNTPRTLVIPGNHDIPLFNLAARLFWPYANYLREFPAVAGLHDSSRLRVIALNTTRPSRHKNGVLSPEQIDHVVECLRQAKPGQLRIVAMHQPIAVERAQDAHDRLRGPLREALQRWAEAGADLVLGGHIHLPYVLPLFSPTERLKRRMWAVQAGTAVSRRVREGIPNSVNIIRWGGVLPLGLCLVERWDYLAEAKAFARARVSALDTGWLPPDPPPITVPAVDPAHLGPVEARP